MTSWKLVGAAIKAQRTWANLSPEQKEQVRKKATVAARSAYTRMQEPNKPKQAAPRAPAGAPAPAPAPAPATPTPAAAEPASSAATPPPTAQPQATPASSASAEGSASTPPGATVPTADAWAGLARKHGPRLARQATTYAVSRTRGGASQLVRLWQRTQQPPSK